MTANQHARCGTHMKYGAHGGQAKMIGKGQQKGKTVYRDTAQTARDWTRYAATRFGKSDYTTYTEGGDIVPSYEVAYEQVNSAADEIKSTGTGRNKNRAYIYSVEIGPGNGRMSEQDFHRIVSEYADQLRQQGHRVEGLTYAVHQHSRHTHAHVTFATQKTVQRKTHMTAKTHLRQVANDLTREAEKTQEKRQEQRQTQEKRQEKRNDQGHDWGRGGW